MVEGVILFQMLDFKLVLVEFQQVSIELFLQPDPRSFLMAAWLSSILSILPKSGVISVFHKQALLQIIDKDVKCDWTQERPHGILSVTRHKIE